MASKDTLFKDMSHELANSGSDPTYFTGLSFLPNPDPVLRKLGKTQYVYDAIKTDPHVIGELRAIRAGLLGYEYHLNAGGTKRIDKQALALCQDVFAQKPSPYWQWSDLLWAVAETVFYGYRAVEVVWEKTGNYILPVKIIPRPNRRFVFTYDGEPRLLTRENPVEGINLPTYKFLIARHMPSFENPYGTAIFSSCFWAYTFKHGGFKHWSQFCERFSIPWTIGKVPDGTAEETKRSFANDLRAMVEMAIAVIPNDGSVEIIEPQAKGETHENFINMCNRELSKALTSQTLAMEIQGNGSRAAAQTHRGREEAGFECDRDMVAHIMNELLQWITELNFSGVSPPQFEFYAEEEARQEWTDVLDKARHFLPIPKKFAYERLQIPEPLDGEEVLGTNAPFPAQPQTPPQKTEFAEHNACHHDHARAQSDAIERAVTQMADDWQPLLNPALDSIQSALSASTSILDFKAKLEDAGKQMDMSVMADTLANLLFAGHLAGRTTDEIE